MLSFDPETHTYRYDGVIVPHVTGVLEDAQLVDTRYFNQKTSELGRQVHLACHYLNEDDLDWASLDSEVVPYVRAYQAFLDETKFEVATSEEIVFNQVYRYAGTLDLRGLFPGDARPTLIDLISGPSYRAKGLQTAAYDLCLSERHHRVALQLKRNGRYVCHPFDDPSDHGVFLGALACYRWRQNK